MANNDLSCLGLGLTVLISFCCFAGCMGHKKSQETTRNSIEQRGYLVPQRFEKPRLIDLDQNGNPESIARYNNRTYLAKLDTNGVPYFVPYKINISSDK